MLHRWLFVMVAMLLGALSPAQAEQPADPMVITFRADPSCPSNCEPADKLPGYDIDIARAIYEPLGYKIDYQLLSWKRTILDVRDGYFDGFISGISTDAPDFVFPEEPGGVLVHGFAMRKGSNWQWAGEKSMQGLMLGIIPEYVYFPEIKAYIDANQHDPRRIFPLAMKDALLLGLKMIPNKRLDLICDDMTLLRWTIAQAKLSDKLDVVGPYGEVVPTFPAFSPHPSRKERSLKLAKIWDDGIRRLRSTGELKKIMARYGLPDWK